MNSQLTSSRLDVLSRFTQGAMLSGADIMRLTDLSSGSVYPMLRAFEEAGFLRSRWEQGWTRALARPRIRYYTLTALGRIVLNAQRDHLRRLLSRLTT